MKYSFFLPLSALIALMTINVLVNAQILPPGMVMLGKAQQSLEGSLFFLIFLVIFLESIIYVGFYFPGQFFAVLLVVSAKPDWQNISYLTLTMVAATTLGSLLNYCLGRLKKRKSNNETTPLKQLLLAMIHINSLAFFMFHQGVNHKKPKIILFAGLLNLPYYLLMIILTMTLSEQIMAMAENPIIVFCAVTLWLVIALIYDIRKHRS